MLPAVAAAADKPKIPPQPDKPLPSRDELEKQFEKSVSNVTLVGHYTVSGQKDESALKTERYEISKVSKLKGDIWLFQAGIHYGKHDVTLPLPLTVKWAGDTPVIELTDLAIPGLGTYSARVLIYGNQYAGTWSAGTHGGQLFGEIVKDGEPKADGDSSKTSDPPRDKKDE
jgi:hypothetical protein